MTLDADTHAVIAKLATLQRRPKSAIAAELLEELTPSLQRIATLLEAATKQRKNLPGDTVHKLEALEELLKHTAAFGLDRMAVALTPATSDQASKAAGRRGRKH
jgi:hypothetical protein